MVVSWIYGCCVSLIAKGEDKRVELIAQMIRIM